MNEGSQCRRCGGGASRGDADKRAHRGAVICVDDDACGSDRCRNRPKCSRYQRGNVAVSVRGVQRCPDQRRMRRVTVGYQECDRTVSELPAVRPGAALAVDVVDVQRAAERGTETRRRSGPAVSMATTQTPGVHRTVQGYGSIMRLT